ncbi:MAG TPA: HEAT repeat domain-containing protein [Verrucomicrobiales bacterium]|nr:HEAT repeat domain-containing protein [Verrucomicrobiales bacterium]
MKLRHLAAASCSLLCTLTVSLAVDAEGVNEDRSRIHSLKPYGRTADTAPAETREAAEKGFRRAKFPPGFQGSLWASEPLLANPVAFSFDAKGRMYIAETHRYRTSVLDIRHYMFMLEDDLANRNQADWERSIKKNFPNDWQNLGVESEVVRLVEDSDGDGKADKSSVYADGFNSILDGIASGVLARPDGVWLANIPGLYKLSGSGPDGKAAKKEEVFRGFGVRFNYTGHDLHGLIKGPDGRLYFSIGDRGTSVKTKEGGTIDVPDEGAIFRCEEDGSHLELVMRGLRNPQELAFDDYGNLFTCDNDSDQGDRERFVYVLEGGDAGWRVGYQHCPQPAERNPWLAEHMWEPRDPAKNQPAYILSPLANLPDGPGGFVHYPGTGLPDNYKGCFFLACYKGSSLTSQVAVLKPVPDGAGFKLELLETFIPGCQATDVDFGPDSRLYVSFWDEGWERTAQGRIMKVEHEEARKAQATQIAEVKQLLAEGMKEREDEALIKLLGHKDQRIRLEAQWELSGRRNAFDQLAAVANHGEERLPRLHAIWGMGAILRKQDREGNVAGAASLSALVKDPDAEVRAQALRVYSELTTGLKPSGAFIEALNDPDPRVAFFAAGALAACGNEDHVKYLIEFAKRSAKSQELRHAAVEAIARLAARIFDAWKPVAAQVHHSNAAVRLVLLLAMKRTFEITEKILEQATELSRVSMKVASKVGGYDDVTLPGELSAKVIADFLSDSDPSITSEAARIINDLDLKSAFPALASRGVESKDPMTILRGYNACFRAGGQSNADRLRFALDDEENRPSPGICVEALSMLAQWHSPALRDRVTGLYRPLIGRNGLGAESAFGDLKKETCECHPSVILQTLKTARALKQKNWDHYAAELALRPGLDPSVRVQALRLAAEFQYPGLTAMLQKAVADPSSTVRIAAAGLLGKTDPVAAAKGLETALAQGTAEDARAAFIELASLSSAEADHILAEQLTLLTGNKVPGVARLELLEAAAKHSMPVVQEALAKYEASLPKDNLLAKFDACLEGGDAVNGKRLFKEHPIAACQRCHMVDKAGGEAGPPLDGIASRKDRRYMLESILLPNAQIAETFRMIVCTMKDGTVRSGVLKSETPDAVTIQSPGEDPMTLKSADISRKDTIPSAMLPNMGELLTKREIRDIVEYLATLK